MPNLTGLAALLKRAQVLATSVLSWLTAASAVLVVLAQQLEGIAGTPEWVTRLVASAVAVIATAIAQVRRVTPVGVVDRGLLPPKGPAVPAQQLDQGAVNVSTLLLVVAVVCLAIFTLASHGTITTDEGFTWLGAGLLSWCLAGLVP